MGTTFGPTSRCHGQSPGKKTDCGSQSYGLPCPLHAQRCWTRCHDFGSARSRCHAISAVTERAEPPSGRRCSSWRRASCARCWPALPHTLGDAVTELVVRGGTVVTPQSIIAADIAIDDGRISAIAPDLPGAAREIDARDLTV